MNEPATYQKIPLPPKFEMPFRPPAEEAAQQVDEMIKRAFSASRASINKALSNLDSKSLQNVRNAAKDAGQEVNPYLIEMLNTLSLCYIGYRTGMATMFEQDRQKDITTGTISNLLTDLSDMIGPHLTVQVYRTLTSNIDTILAEKYGPQK